MSVKKPSFAGSTTDYSEMAFQPNFVQRVPTTYSNQTNQMVQQLQPPAYLNQRVPFQQIDQQTNTRNKQEGPFPSVKDINSTFTMLPEVFQMDQDFLPQEILFLLSEEENHLSKYKQKIDKDKIRIKKDVDIIKQEIINMIDDLCVQMQQFLDEHLKRYRNIYGIFKEEVIHFKQAKLEAPLNLVPPPPSGSYDECSNANLIRELEEMRYRNYVSKVNAYVSELAKQRIEKVQTISRELLQLTSSNNEFYHSEPTIRQLNLIKSEVEERLITKFGDMTDYILPFDFLERNKQKTEIKKNTFESSLPSSAIKSNPYLQEQAIVPTSINPKINLENQFNNIQFNQSQQQLQIKNSIINTHVLQGKIQELQEVQPLTLQHKGMVLCFTHIKDNVIATASKDQTIKIWNNQQLIAELQGHTGGVCTLTVIKANGIPFYLASGSDNGDNSIKIWNLSTLKLHNNLIEHQAAVVALISLDDGQTLISGSYDKSLLIWNIDQQQPIQKLQSHTNAITCLTQCQGRFISGGLDGIINVWKIQYGQNGQFQQASLEKIIKNQTLVCALNCIQIQNTIKIISGGKDGKIREFDLQTGECTQVTSVLNGPIVEMIIVSDQINYSVISMSNKDKNLIMTTQGSIKVLDTNDQVLIEFGCGVYPKMEIIDKNGEQQLYIISQKEQLQKIFKFTL